MPRGETENCLPVSVRSLVEFVLRSGDIDNRRGKDRQEAMAEGSRIHRKLQKERGKDYRAEVSLKKEISCGDFFLLLNGRADGIYTDENGITTIEEIKGVDLDLENLTEPVPVHLAQAVCYGYMEAAKENLSGLNLVITYVSLETDEICRIPGYYSFEELENLVMSYVNAYARWAAFLLEHKKMVKSTVPSLSFPYPYRPGQRDLAVSVYRAISQKKRLFIEAPTGIGKTLSVIFPAVKAMGEGKAEKIFYLTAKTVTRSIAEETFSMLLVKEEGKEAGVSAVTVTAKEKICPLAAAGQEADCNPDQCPYAKGHFDRVNDAVYALISEKLLITREDILSCAMKYQVCPFEMSLDVTNYTDAVICDYNYVFDPNVRLKRYFSDEQTGDYIFLADEAHNLVDRARNMYSAVLCKEDFLESARHYKKRPGNCAKFLTKCNSELLALKKKCEKVLLLQEEDLRPAVLAADRLFHEIDAYYENHPQEKMDEEEAQFFFRLRDFLLIDEKLDDHYQIYAEKTEDGSFFLHLFCMDPSKNLRACLDQGICSVFFSATLHPVRYYKALLTGEENDYAVCADSPFPPDHRLLCVAKDVTTKYSRRTESGFSAVSSYIDRITSLKKGNYLVFCPSYAYLNRLQEALVLNLSAESRELPLLLTQKSNMREEEREEFLQEFAKGDGKMRIGFCIMGGIFSEGIDLPEDALIGVIVVGTGLPQICTEREILKDYFDKRGKDGFSYAYRIPGMNKVEQAAGRLIRTERDKGVLFLLDYRFLSADYKNLFPGDWKDYKTVRLSDVEGTVRGFWESVEKGE